MKLPEVKPTARAVIRLSLAVMCIVLVGCGFQLKGSGQTGAPELAGMTVRLVSAQPRSELTREVTRELTHSGMSLVDDADAAITLILEAEQFTQRNVSLTAQARAAELELTLSAAFTLTQGELDPVDARAVVSRQMLNDPRNVVGKTEELRLLREEMRRDLAAQIVRRISYGITG